MPFYTFKCPKCEYTEQYLLNTNQLNTTIICPKCGQIMVKNLTTNFSVKFNSSGFYTTDYKQKNSTKD